MKLLSAVETSVITTLSKSVILLISYIGVFSVTPFSSVTYCVPSISNVTPATFILLS